MDHYIITGGTIVTLGRPNRVISDGAIRIDRGKIAEIGLASSLVSNYPDLNKIQANQKVIMPGFICAHHHLYSTMARGYCPKGDPAYSFQEILERLWWKLDKALSAEDIRYSALIPLIECIRHGTTTLIDHHASPSYRDGSLDILADAVLESGLRASLCYEVSDRNMAGAGISENERFLKRLDETPSPFLSGMMGLHASFTVSKETLMQCRRIAEKYNAGYHIHVAEGPEDVTYAQKNHNEKRTIERLVDYHIFGEKSLFIHCIHIDDREIKLLQETQTPVVHNPESNMNNAVGVSPVLEMLRREILVGLGTDGMSSHMPAQMRCAYLLHRLHQKDPRVAFVEAPQMLLWNNAQLANRQFSVKLGVIEESAAADLAILNYIPPTELNADNFLGHFIFGMVNASVDSTIVNGKILMENGKLLFLDEEKIAATCSQLAKKMWGRI